MNRKAVSKLKPSGLGQLSAPWFYGLLLGITVGWVLSIAELVCLLFIGKRL